jgi:glycosyltransferase involved in cell wall biosynthesis
MKVVALHTDFRIYWPARLKALSKALSEYNASTLDVIEIAGKGSPYSFSTNSLTENINWHILYPNFKPEELLGKEIKPKLFRLLNEINPDVIIAGAIAFYSGALAVQWRQYHPNCRVVIFDDSKNEAVKRSPIVNFVKRCVYSGADAMFYPATPWVQTGKSWGFSQEQIFFGVDVVDNDFWNSPRQFNNQWGDYFVTIGRQIEKKNFYGIVLAYKQYVDALGKNNSYNLVMIGNGPEHNRIEQLVKSSNLTDKVFLLPFLSQSELPAIYQNAKALCSSSSSSETWGLVINESMACGCPIFASYECGASEVLVHQKKNGYKFHYDDINLLAKYMIDFHKLSTEEQNNMRQASKTIIADWGLDRFCKGAIDAIEYTTNSLQRRNSLLAKLIIRHWHGQYRPV